MLKTDPIFHVAVRTPGHIIYKYYDRNRYRYTHVVVSVGEGNLKYKVMPLYVCLRCSGCAGKARSIVTTRHQIFSHSPRSKAHHAVDLSFMFWNYSESNTSGNTLYYMYTNISSRSIIIIIIQIHMVGGSYN